MKRILLFAAILTIYSFGSIGIYADHHRGSQHEQRDHRDRGHSKFHRQDNPGSRDFKGDNKRHDKYVRDHHKGDVRKYDHYRNDHKRDQHRWNSYLRPGYDRELHKMVSYATRGCRDVKVWRVDQDTFIVRFLKNGRYYTQRLYPYSGRYGVPGVININWSPESFWTLLPSINVNIPIL